MEPFFTTDVTRSLTHVMRSTWLLKLRCICISLISLGGPIVKNKTFFFADYEGSRLTDGAPAEFTVETPQFQNRVITTLPKSLAAQFQKDFPAPAVAKYGNFYRNDPRPVLRPAAPAGRPIPISPTSARQSPAAQPDRADQYTIRIDEHVISHDQFDGAG